MSWNKGLTKETDERVKKFSEMMSGKPSNVLGKHWKLSEKEKKRRSEYNKKMGITFSIVCKGKGYKFPKGNKFGKKFEKEHKPYLMFGKDNPNWKEGGDDKKRENHRLRHSKEWKEWRESVFEYDDYTCWICETRGIKLNPHHLLRFAHYPDLRFVKSNGLTLCEFCHRTYTIFHEKKIKLF